jgi:hypothetical protein
MAAVVGGDLARSWLLSAANLHFAGLAQLRCSGVSRSVVPFQKSRSGSLDCNVVKELYAVVPFR